MCDFMRDLCLTISKLSLSENHYVSVFQALLCVMKYEAVTAVCVNCYVINV